jgi:hypothetical protein
MLPGFTALNTSGGRVMPQGVRSAGPWDNPTPPKGGTCVYSHTTTSCTGVVLWCTEHFRCPDNPDKTKFPYPCGGCIGFDW